MFLNSRQISTTQTSKEGDSSSYQLINVDDMCTMVQKWFEETINAFENENTNMTEQVCFYFY